MDVAPLNPEEFESLITLPDGGDDIAVALSGGPDSMALCWLMSRLAVKHDFTVHAITVDHGLRAEAEAEAEQVARWARSWPKVRHEILKRGASPGNMFRIMERARDDRYELLAMYCETHRIAQLYTAHHMDDQAETFLFRLAKGSGVDGLAGMKPVQDYYGQLSIIRPFLMQPKSRLIATCEAHNIAYVQDPTNDDARFARTRLRRATAVLEKEGLSARRLCVTASRLLRARTALEAYAQKAFDFTLLSVEPGRVVFTFSALIAEPEETRLRVLLTAMDKIAEEDEEGYGPRLERMEVLSNRIFGEDGFKSATLGGCLFAVDRKTNALTIEKEK